MTDQMFDSDLDGYDSAKDARDRYRPLSNEWANGDEDDRPGITKKIVTAIEDYLQALGSAIDAEEGKDDKDSNKIGRMKATQAKLMEGQQVWEARAAKGQ